MANENGSISSNGWQLLAPNCNDNAVCQPVPRDPWGGMLAYNNDLYLFGGAYARYGIPAAPADLSTLGVLNDLWKFNLQKRRWQSLESDDGQSSFSSYAKRPSGRLLPLWNAVDDYFYLFGGLTIVAPGWKTDLLNDLWRYSPQAKCWELIENHDERMLLSATQNGHKRPTALAATGSAVVNRKIYMFGGWGGKQPNVVLSPQLWEYDVDRHTWSLLGNGEQQPWPSKRYCPALTAWNNKLYLWGGRDTQHNDPQFYNDLWVYHIGQSKWEQLIENHPGGTDATSMIPQARYGMGEAQLGDKWYVFGGFGCEQGNSPQLNDFWQLDLKNNSWALIEPHDRLKDTTASAKRPSVRRVPAMTSDNNSVYLFGGLDLTSGQNEVGPLVAFNDLWSYKGR